MHTLLKLLPRAYSSPLHFRSEILLVRGRRVHEGPQVSQTCDSPDRAETPRSVMVGKRKWASDHPMIALC